MKGLILVLDAMGVIYEAADDVAELLMPFIAEKGGREDPDKIKSLYVRASLGEMETDEFWAALGLSPALKMSIWRGTGSAPACSASCATRRRVSMPCGAYPTTFHAGHRSCVRGLPWTASSPGS